MDCQGVVRFFSDSLLSPTTSGWAVNVLYHFNRSSIGLHEDTQRQR